MMEAGRPVWQHKVSPERIRVWQQAVIEGSRIVAINERRATYPANPDPDTVALAEHYRIKWNRARILKAMSYFVAVTAQELADITSTHPALIRSEVQNASRQARMPIQMSVAQRPRVTFYQLANSHDRDELRAVMQAAWFGGEE